MRYRVVAFLAGIALVISLLFGIIGGVPFGLMLVRGLVGAVVFGGFGLVLATILEKFMPEMEPGRAGASEDEAVGGDRDDSGASVDIVLPEEMPHQEDGELEEIQAPSEEPEYSELESMSPEGEELDDGDEGEEMEQVEDVDSLPTLDSLGGFGADDEEEPASDVGRGSAAASKDVDILGHDTNPQEAVKAVRTWLRKDEDR